MIRLKFQAVQDVYSVIIGPAAGFRVAGNFMRRMPDHTVVAQYSRHQWRVRDRGFSRYDCLDPCLIYFADAEGTPSETFGPFDKMHVADGTMYSDDKLFAKFIDESLNWHSLELETYWPNLVLTVITTAKQA
jgi:hypothetical protein